MSSILCLFALNMLISADELPRKYALIVGIDELANLPGPHPELARKDAEALGGLLKSSGYEVDLLLGSKATQAAINAGLTQFRTRGNSGGVAVVGLFGTGIQTGDGDAYLLPFDAKLRAVKDSEGRKLFGPEGQPVLEPDPASVVRLEAVIDAFRLSPAGSRILIADCLKTEQPRARGFADPRPRLRLPDNSAALLACSVGEAGYESHVWGHGALMKALLTEVAEVPPEHLNFGNLCYRVRARTKAMVQETCGRSQTPNFIIHGAPDLGLTKGRK